MYVGVHAKYLLFLSDLNETWNSSSDFKKAKHSDIKFHENPSPVGTELFHADRETDMTKLNDGFLQFL